MGKLRVYCLKTLKKLTIYPLGNTPSAPSDCDSEAAIATAEAENPHKLSKHLDVKLHSIRERIAQRTIRVQSVSTAENTADLLTKSLLIVAFQKHYSCLGLEPLDYNKEEEAEVDAMLTPPQDDEDIPESETRGSVEQ